MKAEEVRALSRGELQQKITELKQQLFNLRFQKGMGQLENPRKIKQTQKDIARIHTVLNATAGNPKNTDQGRI
ncbi:50S ribosomal protein L29 [Desulfatitalea alkaliphila]|uniref:Large ribosomal subunit protein uL29 n=1 Tax=Desulfatitalea alkaliphila TaxID=2929485 RepID=A0AA41US41_9BACT|nr:50S ribosomal protein L29 [Desulfatitalea alkaliphila]MCJ8502918.1 50S ribosomal protein L29 [Desulfatitalea alkaliphila]